MPSCPHRLYQSPFGKPKSGIPKRKKTVGHTPLSCKIDYLLRSNRCDQSMASKYFTDDAVAVCYGNE